MSENVRSEKKLTLRQARAITALMTASTLGDAAKSASISERQLRRWLDDPQFIAALDRSQRQALDASVRRLTALSVAATGVLAHVMGDSLATSASKVRAADIVLTRMMQLRELTQIEQRLAALEAALTDHGRTHV